MRGVAGKSVAPTCSFQIVNERLDWESILPPRTARAEDFSL
jgi:hypothetical protein